MILALTITPSDDMTHSANQSCMAASVCNSSTWENKTEGTGILGQHKLWQTQSHTTMKTKTNKQSFKKENSI